MADTMTFKALSGDAPCALCGSVAATLEFDIKCDPDGSRQHGACCKRCAHNLIDALAQVR